MRTFLANHIGQVMIADLFVAPTVTYKLLFVLVILAHDRRRAVDVAVTNHPTLTWSAHQLHNAFHGDACACGTWQVATHAHQIMAADLLVVPTVNFRVLFVL